MSERGGECEWIMMIGLRLQVMPARPRRNRRSPALRAAFQETTVSPANFILPLFVHEGAVEFSAVYEANYAVVGLECSLVVTPGHYR